MAAVGQPPPTDVPPITQLEFHQAMQDFKTMFPEMDEDVIEVVLRANNGAVDTTIDQLLAMSTDTENERLRAELDATENAELPPSYSPATPPPSYHQAVPFISPSPGHSPVAKPLSNNVGVFLPPRATLCHTLPPSFTSAIEEQPEIPVPEQHQLPPPDVIPLSVIRKWKPALLGPLPSDFLRIEEVEGQTTGQRGVLSSTMLHHKIEENKRQREKKLNDPEAAQYLEDERVALFLQNEEFMRELRHNQEFISTLEKDTGTLPFNKDNRNNQEDAVDMATGEDETTPKDMYNYTLNSEDSEAAFREKLKNMGKVSRRKFAQLAKLFSRRKRPSFRPILGDGTNPSRDNLLLHEDDYSELSGEDSEGELNKKATWNSHGGGGGGTIKRALRHEN